MKKKVIALCAVAALALSLLSGCGKTADEDGTKKSDAPEGVSASIAPNAIQSAEQDPKQEAVDSGDEARATVSPVDSDIKYLTSYGIFNLKDSGAKAVLPESDSLPESLDFSNGARIPGMDPGMAYDNAGLILAPTAVEYKGFTLGSDRSGFDTDVLAYLDMVQSFLKSNFARVFNSPSGFSITGHGSDPAGASDEAIVLTYGGGVVDTAKDTHVYSLTQRTDGHVGVSYTYMCVLEASDLEDAASLDVSSITQLAQYLTGVELNPADVRHMLSEAYGLSKEASDGSDLAMVTAGNINATASAEVSLNWAEAGGSMVVRLTFRSNPV